MAYLDQIYKPQPRRPQPRSVQYGLRGVNWNDPLEGQKSGSCCSDCAATGGSCGGEHGRVHTPPDIMQGPWMGVRLGWDEQYLDYRIPQAGSLPEVDPAPENWEFTLREDLNRWQGY